LLAKLVGDNGIDLEPYYTLPEQAQGSRRSARLASRSGVSQEGEDEHDRDGGAAARSGLDPKRRRTEDLSKRAEAAAATYFAAHGASDCQGEETFSTGSSGDEASAQQGGDGDAEDASQEGGDGDAEDASCQPNADHYPCYKTRVVWPVPFVQRLAASPALSGGAAAGRSSLAAEDEHGAATEDDARSVSTIQDEDSDTAAQPPTRPRVSKMAMLYAPSVRSAARPDPAADASLDEDASAARPDPASLDEDEQYVVDIDTEGETRWATTILKSPPHPGQVLTVNGVWAEIDSILHDEEGFYRVFAQVLDSPPSSAAENSVWAKSAPAAGDDASNPKRRRTEGGAAEDWGGTPFTEILSERVAASAAADASHHRRRVPDTIPIGSSIPIVNEVLEVNNSSGHRMHTAICGRELHVGEFINVDGVLYRIDELYQRLSGNLLRWWVTRA